MKYYTFSTKQIQEKAIELAKRIEISFTPNIVIFIAQGGYYIGKTIADYFDVDLHVVYAERKGSRLKEIVSPIIKRFPTVVRFLLIDLEMRLGIHKKNNGRNVHLPNKLKEVNWKDVKNILIVDDAVDTGNTMISVRRALQDVDQNLNIKTAALCVIHYSEDVIDTDYYIYKDTIIKTSTSKDSNEHSLFMRDYSKWIERYQKVSRE